MRKRAELPPLERAQLAADVARGVPNVIDAAPDPFRTGWGRVGLVIQVGLGTDLLRVGDEVRRVLLASDPSLERLDLELDVSWTDFL